mmetsp:Transcript_59083/g.110720  ORF Transcript_59083/g.110720 Transcript_59083/m.110720 type:complete len:219 (-) Transcript_59083:131-787(-)
MRKIVSMAVPRTASVCHGSMGCSSKTCKMGTTMLATTRIRKTSAIHQAVQLECGSSRRIQTSSRQLCSASHLATSACDVLDLLLPCSRPLRLCCATRLTSSCRLTASDSPNSLNLRLGREDIRLTPHVLEVTVARTEFRTRCGLPSSSTKVACEVTVLRTAKLFGVTWGSFGIFNVEMLIEFFLTGPGGGKSLALRLRTAFRQLSIFSESLSRRLWIS